MATNYYVKADGGSDGNSGADFGNAKEHIPDPRSGENPRKPANIFSRID